MTLTGTDTAAHYDQVLQSISFSSTQLNNGTDTVSWQVTDANNLTSTIKTREVQVTGALFPLISNSTNNTVLPPTTSNPGPETPSPTFVSFSSDNGEAS